MKRIEFYKERFESNIIHDSEIYGVRKSNGTKYLCDWGGYEDGIPTLEELREEYEDDIYEMAEYEDDLEEPTKESEEYLYKLLNIELPKYYEQIVREREKFIEENPELIN